MNWVKNISLVGAMAVGAVSANAQNYNAFLPVSSLTDVTISNVGLDYTVALGASPKFTYNSVDYFICDLFGFWALSGTGPFSPQYALSTLPAVGDVGPFSDASLNTMVNGTQGWSGNPNDGLEPGDSFHFIFDNLNTSQITDYGFHVRLCGDQMFPGTEGGTGFIRIVPEPSSYMALLFGLGLRRKTWSKIGSLVKGRRTA